MAQFAPVVPRPVAVLTVNQWRADPALQAHLKRLFEDPVFQLAQQTLTQVAFFGSEPSGKAQPGVSAEASDQALARRYIHRVGFAFFPKMLKALASPVGTALPTNSYDRLLPEDE